jgi:hypothetical protein
LTIYHLWGRVLAKFQETRTITYTDDGYIKDKLNVTLQVLTDLKYVLKTDVGLEINVSKTSILPKGVTDQTVFDLVQNIIQGKPTLSHLNGDVLLASFCPQGFVGIGVSIGTDVFTQNFVAKTCRVITDDVEKLDTIQDGFIPIRSSGFVRPLDSNK